MQTVFISRASFARFRPAAASNILNLLCLFVDLSSNYISMLCGNNRKRTRCLNVRNFCWQKCEQFAKFIWQWNISNAHWVDQNQVGRWNWQKRFQQVVVFHLKKGGFFDRILESHSFCMSDLIYTGAQVHVVTSIRSIFCVCFSFTFHFTASRCAFSHSNRLKRLQYRRRYRNVSGSRQEIHLK